MPAPIIVPDIHGCLGLLEQVVTDFPDRNFIFLGDLIDRGPDSPGVVAAVRRLHQQGRMTGLIRGNHEDMALAAILDHNEEELKTWVQNGGDRTLAQYARQTSPQPGCATDFEWIRANSVAWMGVETPHGKLLLSHASRPSADLMAGGEENSSIWMREHVWEFQQDIKTPLPEGYLMSIHGHRIQERPVYDDAEKALYLDLGSAAYGNLAVFDSETNELAIFSNNKASLIGEEVLE